MKWRALITQPTVNGPTTSIPKGLGRWDLLREVLKAF